MRAGYDVFCDTGSLAILAAIRRASSRVNGTFQNPVSIKAENRFPSPSNLTPVPRLNVSGLMKFNNPTVELKLQSVGRKSKFDDIRVMHRHRRRRNSPLAANSRSARLTILFVCNCARDTFFTKWSCRKIEIAQLSIASG